MKISVTDNEVLNNILYMMQAKGVRQADIARYLGISKNAVTQWKTHASKSYMDYPEQLAVFFDVSVEDILHTNKDNLYESHLSLDEQQILQDYRSLSKEKKDAIRHLLSTI